MSIFDSLFHKHGNAEAPAQAESMGTGGAPIPALNRPLSYDPDLIPRLTQEHHALERLYNEIKQSHGAKDFAALERALQKFQLTLNLHLATENAEFYGYLYKNLHKNSAEHTVLRDCWTEMQDLGNAVLELVAKHKESGLSADTHTAFGMQLERIGTALLKRIRHEEDKLYGMYAPA